MPDRKRSRVAPTSIDMLSEAVIAARDRNDTLCIRGAGTLDGMGGHVVAGLDVHMTQLKGVAAFEPGDLTIGVYAGTTIAELNAVLREHRLLAVLDAPHPHHATIGGTLAAGWLGPRRHRYGRPRDAVIGTTVVMIDGRIASSGGMVVKNVTGYDLSKLYIGSFGTLGILARVNLKVQPIPARVRAVSARLPEHTRDRVIERLQSLSGQIGAALLIDGFHREIDGEDGSDGRVVVLLETSEILMEQTTRDTRSALGQAGVPEATIVDLGPMDHVARIIDACVATIGERSVTYRVLGDADDNERRSSELTLELMRMGLRVERIVDACNGDIFMRLSDRDSRSFAGKLVDSDEAVHRHFPRAVVVACASPIRDQLNLWGEHPAAIQKMHLLKSAFDPDHRLNPGRFLEIATNA